MAGGRKQKSPVWIRAGKRGMYGGIQMPNGALHFGVRIFNDRSRHYGNQRHGERGIAFWYRRNRRGERGYPHTLTFKVLVA